MFAASIRISTIALAIIAFAAQSVPAAVQSFSDRATFIATTGANTAHPPFASEGMIAGGEAAAYTIGSITITLGSPSYELYIDGWTDLIEGNEIGISGPENLNIQLDTTVYSIGWDFVDANTAPACGDGPCPCFNSTFEVTLKLADEAVDQFSFTAPEGVLAFVGVWSSIAFDRIEIREPGDHCDNEFFGQFYSGQTPPPSLGDMNCDNTVNTDDFPSFVLALTDPEGYAAAMPDCDLNHGDLNADGEVNGLDIQAMVALSVEP